MNSNKFQFWFFVLILSSLIALFSGFLSRFIFDFEFNKKDQQRGYKIEIIEVSSATSVNQDDEVKIFLDFFAKADIENGKKVFKKCSLCHTIEKDQPNKTGPNLFGVFGSSPASKKFDYSNAMKSNKNKWNAQNLHQFLKKPSKYVPSTKMSFAGISDSKDNADVIAYLQSKK